MTQFNQVRSESSADARRKIAHAEAMASMWLNRGNEASTKAAAERAFEKSQNWLDKANDLRESQFGIPERMHELLRQSSSEGRSNG